MRVMDTTLPYNSGTLYYRHSGKVSPGGLLIAVFGGSAAALVLGTVYAYVDLYNPIAGWITFLVTGGTGLAMGVLIKKLIKSGKIRNVPLALLLAIYLSGLMLVTAWEAWLFAFMERTGNHVDFLMLLNPRVIVAILEFLFDHGAWSIGGTEVTRLPLVIVWLIEAGILMGIPIGMGWHAVREVPFCEKCGKWCVIRVIINFNPGDKKAITPRLEGKDFTALTELGQSSTYAMHFWHASFQGCPDCDTTQTLCVADFVLTRDSKGRLQTKRKPVITQLVLSPEDVVAVATAAAMTRGQAAAPEKASG